jgi:hypothetical protein
MILCTLLVFDTPVQAQQSRQQQSQSQQGSRRQMEPSGWILIAYDYDQDGRADAYEYIFAYDLEQARQASRQRPQGQERTQRRSMSGGQTPQQQQMQSGRWRPAVGQGRTGMRQPSAYTRRQPQRRPVQVNGRILDLTTARLSGQQQQHVFAKVETPQGRTVVVDLGPTNQVARLQVYRGDLVEVRGTPARVNQRQVVMASEVRANNQRITVQRPRGSQNVRLEGRILQTATRNLEGPSQPAHVVGLVRLENGQRVPVDFGRREDLANRGIQVRSGQDITLLARTLRIGNHRILAAQSISIDGRQVEVDWLRQRTVAPTQVSRG